VIGFSYVIVATVSSRANAVTQVDQWASFARALPGELFSDSFSVQFQSFRPSQISASPLSRIKGRNG
jgi:hypothetical protein